MRLERLRRVGSESKLLHGCSMCKLQGPAPIGRNVKSSM